MFDLYSSISYDNALAYPCLYMYLFLLIICLSGFDVGNYIGKKFSRQEKYEALQNVVTPGPHFDFPVKTYALKNGKSRKR